MPQSGANKRGSNWRGNSVRTWLLLFKMGERAAYLFEKLMMLEKERTAGSVYLSKQDGMKCSALGKGAYLRNFNLF